MVASRQVAILLPPLAPPPLNSANTSTTTTASTSTFSEFRHWDVGVAFTSPQSIAKLNMEYRGKDGPTDVLSFAYHFISPPCALPVMEGMVVVLEGPATVDAAVATDVEDVDEPEESLGDIVVCPELVLEHANVDGTSLQARLPVVLAHGYCHLLGYTHDDVATTGAMFHAEAEILDHYCRAQHIPLLEPLTGPTHQSSLLLSPLPPPTNPLPPT
jgi:rRNA maturation RNase YbeY